MRMTPDLCTAEAELDLGEAGRFWPGDSVLAPVCELADAGHPDVVCEAT